MTPFFEVFGLNYSFSTEKKVIQDFSYSFEKGKCFSLLGLNGSGKTTLLKILSGIIDFQFGKEGIIRFRKQERNTYSQEEWSKIVTYVDSDIFVDFPMTVFEFVALGRRPHSHSIFGNFNSDDKVKTLKALEEVEALSFKGKFVNQLSGGERQRVALARALCQEPHLLLLDESFSKMDVPFQMKLGEAIKKRVENGLTVIWVSHDLNLLSEFATDVLVLEKGKLTFQGKMNEIFKNDKLKILYPNSQFEIFQTQSGVQKVLFSS